MGVKTPGTKGQRLIKQALKALERQGKLTPDDLVIAAKNPKHPLHDRFDWDDTVAAQRWRVHQAREIINSVQAVVTTESRTLEAPVYVRDPRIQDGSQGYLAIEGMSVRDKRAALLLEVARVVSALDRAQRLAEVFNMVKEVRDITKQVLAFQSKVQSR